jgi:hypothetical protein
MCGPQLPVVGKYVMNADLIGDYFLLIRVIRGHSYFAHSPTVFISFSG